SMTEKPVGSGTVGLVNKTSTMCAADNSGRPPPGAPPGKPRDFAREDPLGPAGQHDGAVHAGILLVDDHAGFRRAARRLLEAGGLRVVGEAANGREALALVERLRPEVVVLDVLLPDMDGFVVATQLAALPAPPTVVLISSRTRSELGVRLDTAPVAGFVTKEEFDSRRVAALAGLSSC
ncbi:MAG: response regulator transcription factor, partial [Actinomycetota bacterium]|nr:response regulator transcription factor [Actinomycetota bacterium]